MLVVPDSVILAREVGEFSLPCMGSEHHRGILGHIASQTGKWLAIAPCCGWRTVYCDGRKEYPVNIGLLLSCTKCGEQWIIERWRFERI